MNEEFLAKKISDAIQNVDSTKPESYDAPAEVLRIENQTAWVHIDGGVAETPVKLTINAKVGDTVQVRVTNGHAFIIGNVTAPPTDDSKAEEAIDYARIANNAANEAVSSAHRANEAAQDAQATADSVRGIAAKAQEDATKANEAAEEAEGHAQTALTNAGLAQTAAGSAQTSANNALLGLSQVESVVDTLNWLTEHSKVTEDTTPVADKKYYKKNQDNTFTLVTDTTGKNPAQEGWYEMDDAISNYVASHLALTDDGLYVMADDTKWKVLIASDGVYIINPDGEQVSIYSAFMQIGKTDGSHIKADSDSLSFHNAQGGSVGEISINNYAEETVYREVTLIPYVNGLGAMTLPANSYVEYIVSPVNDFGLGNPAYKLYYGSVTSMLFPEGELSGNILSLPYTQTVSSYNLTFSVTEEDGYMTIKVTTGNRAVRIAGLSLSYYYTGYSPSYTFGTRKIGKQFGAYSFVEGYNNVAAREYSHAEGIDTQANGYASHAQNEGTIASSKDQTAIGMYNEEDAANQYAFIIGNGSDENNRNNALTVDWNGGLNASGDIADGNNNILANKVNVSDLGAAAFSNDYNDLDNLPTIPPTQADYVIEEGTSGSWKYRKWSSGKIEAWAKITFTYGATTAVGQLHRASISTTFPTALGLSANANVLATMGAAQSVVTVNMSVASSGSGLTGYVFRPTAQSGSSTVAISLYVWED